MKQTYLKLLCCAWLLFLASACASSTGASSGNNTNSGKTGSNSGTAANGGTAEDLSKYRPKFSLPATPAGTSVTNTTSNKVTVTPTNHINARVTALIDTISHLNKSRRYAQGYRIQVYSGTERKAAMDLRTALVTRLNDEGVYLQYKQPTFRLKVGDYFTRVEAQQALLQIRDITPKAMIVVDQINIK